MTTDTPSPATIAPSKTPTYIAYHLRERENKKAIWTRIGAAWAHADGLGLTVDAEIVPLNGRIVLRVPTETQN